MDKKAKHSVFQFSLKRLLLIVGVLSLLFTLYRVWPTVVTDEQAFRIKPGMTMEEVRGILGEPASVQPPKKFNPGAVWGYKQDVFGVWYLWIKFTPDGVVHHTWI